MKTFEDMQCVLLGSRIELIEAAVLEGYNVDWELLISLSLLIQ